MFQGFFFWFPWVHESYLYTTPESSNCAQKSWEILSNLNEEVETVSVSWYVSVAQNSWEEILHHLGCIKPCKSTVIFSIQHDMPPSSGRTPNLGVGPWVRPASGLTDICVCPKLHIFRGQICINIYSSNMIAIWQHISNISKQLVS